tara:strand:- start:2026 stop:2250 length:225 start_codon:yes stop_codon:yes gene_type:complete
LEGEEELNAPRRVTPFFENKKKKTHERIPHAFFFFFFFFFFSSRKTLPRTSKTSPAMFSVLFQTLVPLRSGDLL